MKPNSTTVPAKELTNETWKPTEFLKGNAKKISTTDLSRIKELRSKIRDTGRQSLTVAERKEAQTLGLTPVVE